MTEAEEKPLDHEYDGIRELDNDLPRWWRWLFYVTIIWAVIYLLYYHVLGIGYSSADKYVREMDPAYVRAADRAPKYFGILPEYRSPLAATPAETRSDELSTAVRRAVPMNRESDTTAYVLTLDDATLAAGREIYLRHCATCHGAGGEGGVGPNLTDDYWLHGGSAADIVKTIRYGFPTKGMVAWLGTLNPDDILKAASYVKSMHGSNQPHAKAPEGELYTE